MATLFIGQNKVFLPETESTNSYAISLLKNVKPIEGTVVYTHKQTQGKGQRGNSWIAEPQQNTTLSLILQPTFLRSKNSFYLSKIAALALHDVLTGFLAAGQFDIKIKWPNDMLVNSKKIAGVLIENSLLHDSLQWSVIGIGLNVNQRNFKTLPEATSLNLLTGAVIDLETVSESLFAHFEKWYLRLKKGEFRLINEAYHKALFRFDQNATFEQNGKRFNGKIKEVNEGGLLVVETESGLSNYEIKDIRIIY
jgi:BirA family transcriptional regulator, biotin operon repressor / biotin---[acetyl-CoA-carboxylase] ligase